MTATTPTRSSTRRLLPAVATLAVVLAACGGDVDVAEPAAIEAEADGPSVSAPLPGDAVDREPSTSGLCAEGEPDCDDTLDGDTTATCLAGAEDCADDPSGGIDVVRPVPLTDELPEAEPLQREATNGATGAVIVAAVVTDAGLGLAVEGTVCDVVEDVLVIESPEEVRVLVLTGAPSGTDCDVTPATRTVDVELSAPLGDRALLDLAG